MKILLIRHADPDYSIDSLTQKGKKEAELLSQRIIKSDIKSFYVSPLGRARHTAEYTLEKLGREATVCDWLREFHAPINRPDKEEKIIPWDWYPNDWTKDERFFDFEKWGENPAMREGKVAEEYTRVTDEFDKILANHGYERNGKVYNVTASNEDIVAFFCHFGVECVLLSHLLNISPMLIWHGFCAAPSSVTTLATEEREKGTAYFRMTGFGDISHLFAADEKPSFAARFCETYDNFDQRHD